MPTTPRARSVRSESQTQQSPQVPPSSSRRSRVPVVEIPSSRRASSSTPIPGSAARSRSANTASPHPHTHHKSADELALEEAEEILDHDDVEEGGDARSRRHLRLSRLRNQASMEVESVVDHDEQEVEERSELRVLPKSTKSSTSSKREEDEVALDEIVAERPKVQDDETTGSMLDENEVSLDTPSVHSEAEAEEAVVAVVSSGSASGSKSDSDSDSESDSDSDEESSATSADDSDDDADSEDEELEKLLQAARVSAANKPSSAANPESGVLGGDGDVVSIDQERQQREEPIPDISITKLPKPHMTFSAEGVARAADAPLILAGPSRPRSRVDQRSSKGEKVPELDAQPFERALSKREKAAATASELWSTLPAPKADLLPQMKRDYQALSLANSLDPKRFMKGGNRSGKIPENFAIGTLVEAPRHLQDTTLTREKQYRPGQIVQSLTRDEGTESYAKRKYGDLQTKRMENGRGRGWKKQKGW